jgi:hypothetical protein
MSHNSEQGRNGRTMSTPSKPGRPWWRPLVDGLDGRVTPPINSLVRTNVFADSVALATRLEVRVRRRVERQSTWLLHQYNLPTAGDVRKMRAQLAAVEARLRDLSERLEDQHQVTPRFETPTTTRQTRRAAASAKAGGQRTV